MSFESGHEFKPTKELFFEVFFEQKFTDQMIEIITSNKLISMRQKYHYNTICKYYKKYPNEMNR